MSWVDVFYHENVEKRKKVVQLFTKLMTLMEGNFKRTNDLIDVIHEHLPGRTFMKITVDDNKTIKENCDTLIHKINEIQSYIGEKQKKLKELLEPELYKKLMDIKISFGEKLRLGQTISSVTLASISSVAGIAVVSLISKGKILVKMAQQVTKFGACAIASVALAVVALGVDMIISAILGAVERDKLDQSLQDLEAALQQFDPASYKYSKKIEKVIILIEIYAEDPDLINEIQSYIGEKQKKLKELLEPELYKKLMDIKISFGEKLRLGRTISSVTLASISSVAGIAVVSLISKGKILVKMIQQVTRFGACAIASVALAVVALGVDMIISAIIGAVERDKLDQSIQDLEAALHDFEPASYKYSKKIEKVIILIEIYAEDPDL